MKAFLMCLVLISSPVLAAEWLTIAPVWKDDDIPKKVKTAERAIGIMKGGGEGRVGFFLDNGGVFVTTFDSDLDPSSSYEVHQFKFDSQGEYDMLPVGKTTLTTKMQEKGWGVFKVKPGGLKTPDTFLKIGDFKKGDRIFLLSYNGKNKGSLSMKRLVMEVVRSSNSPEITDIETAHLDIDKSPSLRLGIREDLENSIAVNQRGEVIGFLRFNSHEAAKGIFPDTNRLVKFDSEIKRFFLKGAEIIRKEIAQEHNEGKATEDNTGKKNLLERCKLFFQ